MNKTDFGSHLRHSFETQTYEGGEMATNRTQGNMTSGKIGCVQRTFETAPSDGDNTAEDRGVPKERKEVGDEADTGIVGQGSQHLEVLGRFTTVQAWESRAKEEDVDSLLLCLDFLAYFIYNANQAHVRLDKHIFASRIERHTLGHYAVPGMLGTAYEVSTRFAGVLCKLLESGFPNAAGSSYKDCDKARREGRRDEGIGRLDGRKGNHCHRQSNSTIAIFTFW